MGPCTQKGGAGGRGAGIFWSHSRVRILTHRSSAGRGPRRELCRGWGPGGRKGDPWRGTPIWAKHSTSTRAQMPLQVLSTIASLLRPLWHVATSASLGRYAGRAGDRSFVYSFFRSFDYLEETLDGTLRGKGGGGGEVDIFWCRGRARVAADRSSPRRGPRRHCAGWAVGCMGKEDPWRGTPAGARRSTRTRVLEPCAKEAGASDFTRRTKPSRGVTEGHVPQGS